MNRGKLFKIAFALFGVFAIQGVLAETKPDQTFFGRGVVDSFTPFGRFSGGEAISLVDGNLFLKAHEVKIPGRSGLDISLNLSVSTGRQEFVFDKLLLRYPGEASEGLDKIVYDNKDVLLGPLGHVSSTTITTTDFDYPFTTLSYDAASKGWNTSWAENKGVVILSSVSPHKTFAGEEDQNRKQVLLVKSMGAIERYSYLTGYSLAKKMNGKFVTSLTGDTSSLDELILLGPDGRQFKFLRSTSDVFPYRAERSWQCGPFFYKHTCYASEYHNGWQVDAFILKDVRDQYGNVVEATPVIASPGVTQNVSDGLGRTLIRHVAGDSEDWSLFNADGETVHWRFLFDNEHRLVRVVDPENDVTVYEYDYAIATTTIPALRRAGLEHLRTPTEFMQVTYPSGGVIRYEMFHQDTEEATDAGINYNKQVIVTEIPDLLNLGVFYQKYYIVIGRETYVDTTAYNSDGSTVDYHFERKNGYTLLKNRTSIANGATIAESYDWQMGDDEGAVAGISQITVTRDGNSYTAFRATFDELDRQITLTDAVNATSQLSYKLSVDDIERSLGGSPHASLSYLSDTMSQVNVVSRVEKNVLGSVYEGRYYYGGTDICGNDIKGNALNKISKAYGGGDERIVKSFCYDSFGNTTKVREGDSAEFSELNIAYDPQGLYKNTVTQGSISSHYEFNNGFLKHIAHQNGSKTKYEYDDNGRLKRIEFGQDYGDSFAVNYSIEHEYAPTNVRTIVHDGSPSGAFVVNRTYDGLGALVREDKNGLVRQYGYDFDRRLSSITYGDGKKVTLVYDGFGRLIFKQLPGLDTISYSYALTNVDGLGLRDTSNTYVGGNITHRKFYDLLGHLAEEIKYAGGEELITRYGYDNLGNVTNIASPAGFSISNVYNYSNDTLVRTYADGNRAAIDEMGDAGNPILTSRTDLIGGSVPARFNYDEMGRLAGIDLPDIGGRQLNDVGVSYGAADTNAEGRINEIRDFYGTTEFWYGDGGSTGGVERRISSLGGNYKFNYLRDGFGNVEEIVYPHGLRIHYVRDSKRRVSEVRQGRAQGLKIAEFNYNSDGNVAVVKYANGTTTNFTYDLAGHVSRITVRRGSVYIGDEQYTYDGRGRKTGTAHLDGSRVAYSYDDSNRLTKAEYFKSEATTPYDSQNYSYDADGNRIRYSDFSKELRYENNSNKLTAIYRHSPAAERQLASFEYSLGSLVRQTENEGGETVLNKAYTFDNARQLSGVHVVDQKNGFETQSGYTYDYAGRRESASIDGETTYYGYGDDPEPLIEINDRGEVRAAHIYVGGLRLAVIEGDSLKIFHSDDIGSTLNITDEDGVVIQTARYDPFGNVNFLNGSDDNTYLFAGKPYDRATGLIYFGARYYDPETGRYISQDPKEQGTNHYIYAGNNPLTNRDLFGLWFGGGMDGPSDMGYDSGWQGPRANFLPGTGMEGVGLDPSGTFFGGMVFNLFSGFLNIAGIRMPQIDMSEIGRTVLNSNLGNYANHESSSDDGDPCEHEKCVSLVELGLYDVNVTFNRRDDSSSVSGIDEQDIGSYGADRQSDNQQQVSSGGETSSESSYGFYPVSLNNNAPQFSYNSVEQFSPVAHSGSPISPPSYEFQPVVNSGVGTYVPQPGLPVSYPSEVSEWSRPTEFPTRPSEVGGLSEKPDKPSSTVQEQHEEMNTIEHINNAGDPILLHSGEFIETKVDLKIPGVGIDYEFKRTYRSRISYNGPLGYNWDHNYNKRLVELPNGNIARYDGDARFDIYLKNAGPTYKTPVGRFDVLAKTGDGYRIRDSSGLVSNYDIGGKIVSITDSNGNSLSFSYATIADQAMLSQITDTTGRQIVYEYDAARRLTRVTDYAGRGVNLSYDSNGDLSSVSSPLAARTTYAYSNGFSEDRAGLNHNLISITDAKRQTYLYNEYSVFDRVVRQRFGEEGSFEFDYRELLPTGECVNESEIGDAIHRTRVKDRSGNITISDFNCQGNPLRVEEFTRGVRAGDPESFVTRYRYNTDGLVTEIIYPEGDRIALEYERHDTLPYVSRLSAGNLLRFEKIPDADRGGGVPLVTSFLYEPLYNKPVMIVDPRGEAYATWLWYDYQEGMSAAGVSAALGIDEDVFRSSYSYLSLGVGDMNGDGRISQVGGNLILVQKPLAHDLAGIGQELIKRFQYNTRGKLTRSLDEAGVATDYTYNDNGYPAETIVDPNGLRITQTLARNSVGDLTSYTDPRGNTERYTLDDGGRVTEFDNVLGVKTRFVYDVNYNLAQIDRQHLDEDGRVIDGNEWLTTSFEYDWLDKIVLKREEIAEGYGAITEYQYDENENLSRVIHPEGNGTFIEYDERDLAYRVTKGYGSETASTTVINYDGDKNVASVTDGLGSTILYAYDGFNRRTRKTDAIGTQTILYYDPANQITRLQEMSGEEILTEIDYTYDEAKRLIRQSKALVTSGAITGRANYDNTYTPIGFVSRRTNPVGGTCTNVYDRGGRLTSTTDPAGNQTIKTYDANGNILTTTLHAAVDITTSYEYDAENHVTRKTDNAGNTWNFRYDGVGHLVSIVDPAGAGVRADYDGMGRVTRRINSVAGREISTAFRWDDNSRLVSQLDARGNESRLEYDELDRRTATIMPNGDRYSFQYDANSNPSLLVQPDGMQTLFYYDGVGGLVRREYKLGTAPQGRDEFVRDGLGRMMRARTFSREGAIAADVEYDYNSLGDTVAEAQFGEAVASARDLAGIRTAVAYPGDVSILETRDPIGRISNIGRSLSGDLAVFGYYDPIRKSSAAYQNGTTAAFGYNSAALLDAIAWRNADGSGIASHALTYDTAGKIVADNTQTYTYDGANRLVRDSRFEYAYDDANNFTHVTEVSSGTETNFTSNNLNQYTTVDATTISYDENGNVTHDGRFEYSYNWRNQITNVYDAASGAVIADYAYDALGRRISKFNHETGEGTRYFYDGWRLIEEREGDGTLTASFIYNGIGEPVAMVRGSDTYFYHYDARGSIEAVTDASGEVVERYSYESYGKVSITDVSGVSRIESAIGNPFFFTGQVFDVETGLYYFINRFYSPLLGRFMSRDPIGYLDGTNLYAYVGDDPINFIDPFGLAKVNWQNSYWGGLTGYPIYGPSNVQTGNVWIDPTIGVANDVSNIVYGALGIVGKATAYVEDFTGVSFDELYIASLGVPTPAEIDTMAAAALKGLSNLGRADGMLGGTVGKVLANERGAVGRTYDLVYGPSANLKLFTLADELGSKTLTSFYKPYDLTWIEFSKQTLNNAVTKNQSVLFDLTNMENIDGVLRGTGPYTNMVTGQELRYIRDNWNVFKNTVQFYKNGREVGPPW